MSTILKRDWRLLDIIERLNVLANHYETAINFSTASGIPARTLHKIFDAATLPGLQKLIDSNIVQKGLVNARRKMTRELRSSIQKSRKGKFEAPIVRTPTSVLTPKRHMIHIVNRDTVGNRRDRFFKSHWVSYRVEHLPEDEIFRYARELFDLFMDTGQFNEFRFEYIADAEIYAQGKIFLDKGLYFQARESDIVRLSSIGYPFPNFEGDPNYFEQYIREDWEKLKTKGAVRIIDLMWTDQTDFHKVMKEVKRDYDILKRKRTRSAKKKGGRGIS